MRRILPLGLALTLAACGPEDEPAAPPPTSVAGSYRLATVDGHALPVPVFELGAYRVQLTSGTLALSAAGRYALELALRVEDSGNVRAQTDSNVGRWTTTGTTLSLVGTEGATFEGTVAGGAITLRSGTRVLVLRR